MPQFCFNTIAVLFMTELDNITYSIGLSEPVRTLVEVGARLELDKTDVSMLWRSKVAHMSCIMLAVVVAMIRATAFGFILVPVAFGVAGAVVELGRESLAASSAAPMDEGTPDLQRNVPKKEASRRRRRAPPPSGTSSSEDPARTSHVTHGNPARSSACGGSHRQR